MLKILFKLAILVALGSYYITRLGKTRYSFRIYRQNSILNRKKYFRKSIH